MAGDKDISTLLKVDKSAPDSVHFYTGKIKALNKELEKLQRQLGGLSATDFERQKPLLKKIGTVRGSLKEAKSSSGYKQLTDKQNDQLLDGLIARGLNRSKSRQGRILNKRDSIGNYPPEIQKIITLAQNMLKNPEFVARQLSTKPERAKAFSERAKNASKENEQYFKDQKLLQDKQDKYLSDLLAHQKAEGAYRTKKIREEKVRSRKSEQKLERKRLAEEVAARRRTLEAASVKGKTKSIVKELEDSAIKNKGRVLQNINSFKSTGGQVERERLLRVQKSVSDPAFIKSKFPNATTGERATIQRNADLSYQAMKKFNAEITKSTNSVAKNSQATDKNTAKKNAGGGGKGNYQFGGVQGGRSSNDRFRTQAAVLGNYAILGAGLGGIQATLAFTIELDKAFKQLQSIVRLTNTEMATLETTLINVSEKTKFTAVEVAEAATVLGQAGFSKDQIEKAIEPITLFATAVGTDLKQAVELSTSVMGIFSMNATQMADSANIMTTAINKSKLTMDKLSLGLQYSGNLAAQAGIDFKEVVALLGAMANSGIRAGSMLGTGFRQVLIALQAPTDKFKAKLKELNISISDIDVRTHGMVNVLKMLTKSGFTSADAMQVLQTRSAAAYSAMVNNVDVADKLTLAMGATASASEANAIQMTSLANQWARFKSIALSLGAEMFEPMKNVLTDVLEGLSTGLKYLKEWKTTLQIVGSGVGAFVLLAGMKKLTALVASIKLSGPMGTGVASPVGMPAAGMGSRIGGALMRTLPLLGAAGLIYGLGSEVFGNGESDLNNLADKQKASVNNTQGKAGSLAKDIDRVQAAIETLYSRSVLDDEALTQQIEQVELSFKDLNFTLTDVKGGVDLAIEDLRRLKAELVNQSLSENSTLLAQQKSLVVSQTGQLGTALSQPFYTSNLYTGPNQSFKPQLARGVNELRYAADAFRTSGLPSTVEGSQDFRRRLTTLRGGVAKSYNSGDYTEGSPESKELLNILDRLAEIEAKNGNLLATLAEIETTKSKEQTIKDTQELNDKFTGAIKQLRTDFVELSGKSLYGKDKSLLEKANQAEGLKTQLTGEANNLIEKIKNFKLRDGSSPSDSAINVILQEILSVIGDVKTFKTEKFTDAEYEKGVVVEAKKRSKSKELDTLVSKIGSTLDKGALTNYIEEAKSVSNEIEQLVFDKRAITLKEGSQAYLSAEISKRKAQLSRSEKLDVTLANNLDRLEANQIAKGIYDGTGTLDGSTLSRVGDRALRKALDTGFRGAKSDIDSRYQENLKLGLPFERAAVRNNFDLGQELDSFNDSGLSDRSRSSAATKAMEALAKALTNTNEAINKNSEALSIKIQDLKELRTKKEEVLKVDSKGSEVYQRAEARIKELDVDIKKLEVKVLDNNTKLDKNTADSEKDRLDLADNSALLGFSESLFNDERRRKVKAELQGGQYRTDSGNTESFQGRSAGVFEQVVNQTNAQFKGFDVLTESVLELQGVVDGLGEHVASAMMEFVTGAKSAQDAFKSMIMGILEDMARAATRMVTNQLMMALFTSLAGSFTSGGSVAGAGGSSGYSGSLGPPQFTGGVVQGGSFYKGGLINRGKSQRDSTLINAAKGEFVVRKEAVDAIGVDSMFQLNALTKSGAKAKQSASRAGASATTVVAPKTETNVYLLDKTTPPQSLRPSDVVAVISDDIARSGQTKTLIKQVLNGSI